MPYSQQFKDLRARAAELRKRFLPKNFSKTGAYTDEKLDNARAYRVLIHAEFEHYFESRVLVIAIKARDAWTNKNKVSVPLVHLLCVKKEGQRGLPKELGSSVTAHTVAGQSCSFFEQAVKENHGIRIHNMLSMLLPVGVREQDIDTVWLNTLDSFGTKRGETAHTTGIKKQIDPKDEHTTVLAIIQGIKDLETVFSMLEKATI